MITGQHSRPYSRLGDALAGVKENRRRARGWQPAHRTLSLKEWGAAFMKSFKAASGLTVVQSDLTRAR